jgi:hypothetical protein
VPSTGRSRLWLWGIWAIGSALTVMLLVGGAYAAHHAVVNTRTLPPVPAGTVPPLEVVAATAPGPSYELLAEDAPAGHVAALASASQPICPPIGLCPPSAPLDSFVVFNASTGAILSRTLVRGTSGAASVLLLVNDQSHIAYAVAPRSVSLFSTITGTSLGGYTLPASISWAKETGGVYDPPHHALILSGGGQLAVLDAATGGLRRLVRIGVSSEEDGPVLDMFSDTLSLLALGTPTTVPRLLVYNAVTLDHVSQMPLPLAIGLGPLTPDGRFIVVYEKAGVVAFQPSPSARTGTTTQVVPAAAGAKALGWLDGRGGVSVARDLSDPLDGSAIYVATATGIDLRNAGTGKILASLPMPVAWSGADPLLVDAQSGSVYLPSSHGQVVVVRYPKSGGSVDLGAGTAVVLAHSALASFLPFTNQDPPFVTPDSFLLSATPTGQTIPMTYWIHYVDFQWSMGPYPGTTSAIVIPDNAHVGGYYLVTFRITWFETYLRSHTWVCAVAPDGSVALRSDSGDLVP